MILNCIAGSKYSPVRILRMFYSLPVFGGAVFSANKRIKKHAESYSGASAEPCQITSSVPFLTLTVAGLPVNSLLTPNGKS